MRLLPLVWVLVASTAAAETPTETARKLVDIQVKDMLARTDLRVGRMLDGDVVLLTSQTATAWADEAAHALEWVLMDGSPHSELRTAKVTSIVGGGDDKVVWLTAEIAATYYNREPEEKGVMRPVKARLTELAVHGDDGWKIIAAAGDQPSAGPNKFGGTEVDKPTKPGPLAALAASPTALEAALSSDAGAFVLGTAPNERAIGGAAAKKLVHGWAKLRLEVDGKVREVQTPRVAFAQLRLKWTKDKDVFHMGALVIALPGDGGTWRVVAVHYL